MDNDNKDRRLKLAFMSDELQCMYEDIYIANDMLTHLQELRDDQSCTTHKMHDGQFVHDYCLIMIKDIWSLRSST